MNGADIENGSPIEQVDDRRIRSRRFDHLPGVLVANVDGDGVAGRYEGRDDATTEDPCSTGDEHAGTHVVSGSSRPATATRPPPISAKSTRPPTLTTTSATPSPPVFAR